MIRAIRLTFVCLFVTVAFGFAHPAHAQTYTESVLYSFCSDTNCTDGSEPFGAPIQASDGNFYGLAGSNAFRLTPSGVLTTLHVFCSQGGSTCPDGSGLTSSLVEGTDGNFYGTTAFGGANTQPCSPETGCGTVFSLTPAGTLTTLYNFCSVGGSECSDGDFPETSLVQGNDGNFYGTTSSGGANGTGNAAGTIFSITPAGKLTTLYRFCLQGGSCVDGQAPYAALVQGADGDFYGSTSAGGANADGTIFRISASGTFKKLYDFCSLSNCADGASPTTPLVQATDGSFYGITTQGGPANTSGTFFNITPLGVLTTLYSFFCSANDTCTNGSQPAAGLFLASDGNLYGATEQASNGDGGTVFKISPSGTITTLYSFPAGASGTYLQGGFPFSGPTQAADGNFYGDTIEGGANDGGAVYELAVSPPLTPPVKITLSPAKVALGSSFTLSYTVANAFSTTLQQCFATNSAGNSVWTGAKTGKTTTQSVTLTASSTTASYTYALTCGGTETGLATLEVVFPSSTVLTASTNKLSVGQTGTLTATVSGSDGTPAGTVNLAVEGDTIASGPLSSGVYSITVNTNGISPGTYPIVANYSGSMTYIASSSPAVTVVLEPAPTTTTLTESPNPVTPPANGTLTATVKRSAPATVGTPAGSVTFYYGTLAIASAKLNGAGVASVAVSTNGVPAGQYGITARYNGDGYDAVSASAAVNVTVR